MKFLLCIFISTFCVFTQARFLSLDDLIDSTTNKGISLRFLPQTAEQGHVDAQLELAGVYLRAHYNKKNIEKASDELRQSFYWFTEAANQGNADAQTILGTIYCCSNSWNFKARKDFIFQSPLVKKDWATAFYWFEKAAEQGHPEAQYRMASMLLEGTVIEKKTAKGMALLRTLAEKGNEEAQVDLCEAIIFDGLYKHQDELMETVNTIKKLANQGNADAQTILGLIYSAGGIEYILKDHPLFSEYLFPVDYERAYYWFKKAADQDEENAISMMLVLELENKILLDEKRVQKPKENLGLSSVR